MPGKEITPNIPLKKNISEINIKISTKAADDDLC